MKAPDLTMVSAPQGFWEDQLAKQFQIKGYLEVIKIKDNEIVISSDDSKDVLEEILKLSKENPDHKFRVKTDSKSHWDNFVYLYECENGVSKLIFEGYEYIYSISTDGNDYDENDLIDFKKKLTEFYQKIDSPKPEKIHPGISMAVFQSAGESNIDDLSYVVTYNSDKSCFKATRNGMTFIQIKVEECQLPF